MSSNRQPSTPEYLARYLQRVLEERTAEAQAPGGVPIHEYGAGHLGPTFWADAPWRLEPGEAAIPFTFIVRDGQGESTQVRLDEIQVLEAPDDALPWDQKTWQPVHSFKEGLGPVDRKLWTYRPTPGLPMGPPPTIDLSRFATAQPGRPLLLQVAFRGSKRHPMLGMRRFEVRKSLRIFLAQEPLPLRQSAQWYYGDTHYHSSYTNDVKEFGNPVPDTRAAALALGLDWLIITDHSVDLVDANPYWEHPQTASRWDDLGLEVRTNSDDRLRLLRGEEVTVLGVPGRGDNTLHMLVFGARLERLIPGAFGKKKHLAQVLASLKQFSKELYEHLFGEIYPLEAVLSGVDQKGKAVAALRARSVQAQGALAFAAHPATMAQAPGGVWEFHDLAQPIQGMEAWNGRLSYVSNQEDSPFDQWQPATPWDESANKQGIERWDEMLRQRAGLDDPRFVLLAGSDAHGSFNFSEGWWLDWDGLRADDNCLGKVRTLLYLPHRDPAGSRIAPSEAEIVDAIRTGSCIVTDGPVLNAVLRCNGAQATLGQILAADGGDFDVQVQAVSTAEFGPVTEVELFYYFRGMDQTTSVSLPYVIGQTQLVASDLPATPGYVRLAITTHTGREAFRCFTNPIWIRPADTGRVNIGVTCVDWQLAT